MKRTYHVNNSGHSLDTFIKSTRLLEVGHYDKLAAIWAPFFSKVVSEPWHRSAYSSYNQIAELKKNIDDV